jgi:hypothetical protein
MKITGRKKSIDVFHFLKNSSTFLLNSSAWSISVLWLLLGNIQQLALGMF